MSKATLCNWILDVDKYYGKILVEYMHRQLLKSHVLHCDETPVQVVREEIYRDIKKLASCFSPVIVFQQHVLHGINDCVNLYRRRFPVNVDCLVCRETIDCPFQDFIRTVSDNNRRSHHGLDFLLDLIFQDQPFFLL